MSLRTLSAPLEASAQRYFTHYLERTGSFYTLLFCLLGAGEALIYFYLTRSLPVTLTLPLGILVVALLLLKLRQVDVSCGLASFCLAIFAHQLSSQQSANLDLTLANLAVVALAREYRCLGFYLAGAFISYGISPSALIAGGFLYWSWAFLLFAFSFLLALSARKTIWSQCVDAARARQHDEETSYRALLDEAERTSRLQRMLDEVLEFCRSVASSGALLYDMGESQEASNRQIIRATRQIGERSETVLAGCLASAQTLNDLQQRSQESLGTAQSGEQGLAQGRSLVFSIQNAAQLVGDRLRVILGRKQQVSSLVVSIRKTAERVRIISLHAAMEAERASSNSDNFRYVADEIRDLGNRLDVSSLHVERILRGIEEIVNLNLRSVENFQRQSTQSLTILEEVALNLGTIRANLAEAELRLQESSGLLQRQENEVLQMQECTRELEERQRTGEAARQELQSVLTHLSKTLEKVSWAAAEL